MRLVRTAQALISAEGVAEFAAHNFRGNGRQLAFEIGLKERPECDLDSLEVAQHFAKLQFGPDATEDEMRMLIAGWQQSACHFDARVADLRGLLRWWKITPHESVDVRFVVGGNLRESGHRFFSVHSEF